MSWNEFHELLLVCLTSFTSNSRFCCVWGVHWRRTAKISGADVLGLSSISRHPGQPGSKKDNSCWWQVSQSGGSTHGWIIGLMRTGGSDSGGRARPGGSSSSRVILLWGKGTIILRTLHIKPFTFHISHWNPFCRQSWSKCPLDVTRQIGRWDQIKQWMINMIKYYSAIFNHVMTDDNNLEMKPWSPAWRENTITIWLRNSNLSNNLQKQTCKIYSIKHDLHQASSATGQKPKSVRQVVCSADNILPLRSTENSAKRISDE